MPVGTDKVSSTPPDILNPTDSLALDFLFLVICRRRFRVMRVMGSSLSYCETEDQTPFMHVTPSKTSERIHSSVSGSKVRAKLESPILSRDIFLSAVLR